MVLKVSVRPSKIGRGVFANRKIRSGETAFFVTGRLLTFEQVLDLPGEGDRAIQIGNRTYVNPGFPAEFLNHSCDPNAGIRDGLCIVALRDIHKDEEIRFDYSTCIQEKFWRMECACGSPKCRKVIGDFDQLPRALQQYYVGLGVVQPFILEMLPVRLPAALPGRRPILAALPAPRRTPELAVR